MLHKCVRRQCRNVLINLAERLVGKSPGGWRMAPGFEVLENWRKVQEVVKEAKWTQSLQKAKCKLEAENMATL